METSPTTSDLSVRAILKDWWKAVQAKGLFTLGALLLVGLAYVAMIAIFVVPAAVLPMNNIFVVIPWVLLYAAALFYGAFMIARALVKIQLMLVDQTNLTYGELFPSFQEFQSSWRFFLLIAVWYFLIGLSFVALIIPGIIVALGLWPVFFKAFEENNFSLSQIKATWNSTKGFKLFTFKFFLALFFIGLLSGVISSIWSTLEPVSGLILGGVLTLATSFLGMTVHGFLYRKISPKK